jgi:hypothetical protein
MRSGLIVPTADIAFSIRQPSVNSHLNYRHFVGTYLSCLKDRGISTKQTKKTIIKKMLASQKLIQKSKKECAARPIRSFPCVQRSHSSLQNKQSTLN